MRTEKNVTFTIYVQDQRFSKAFEKLKEQYLGLKREIEEKITQCIIACA